MRFDALENAIRNYIAPDLRETLKTADRVELYSPQRFIDIPLQADVAVAYDKGLGSFTIEARFADNKKGLLCGRAIFTTKDIEKAADKSAFVEYVFEQAKRDFNIKLAEGILQEIIEKQHPMFKPTEQGE